MPRIADLPLLAALPSIELLGATDAMRAAFSRPTPGMYVGRALYRQARAGLLAPGMRAWALALSEVACPRLPGGALPSDEQLGGFRFGPGVVDRGEQSHDLTCPCGNWRNHDRDSWMVAMGETMHAVRERDGHRLFEVFDRTVYAPVGPVAQQANNYVASLASSACAACADAGLSRDLDALVHTLAYHAHSPGAWSAACVIYRLAAATLATVDLGPSMASDILSPEITVLANLTAEQRLLAMAVVGPAYAELLSDDPADEVESIDIVASQAGVPADFNLSTTTQAEGSRIAARVAIAYRFAIQAKSTPEYGERRAALADLVKSVGHKGVALALYGMTNMLAVRVRELYS